MCNLEVSCKRARIKKEGRSKSVLMVTTPKRKGWWRQNCKTGQTTTFMIHFHMPTSYVLSLAEMGRNHGVGAAPEMTDVFTCHDSWFWCLKMGSFLYMMK